MQVENWMFCGVLGIGFLYLFLVTFGTIPESGIEHAKTIVGFLLGSVISLLVGYKWGTSAGSAEKSKTIDKQIESQNTQIAAQMKVKEEAGEKKP